MSGDVNALQEAKQKLDDLLEAAKAGSIIPIRLPSQVEDIVTLLAQAEEDHAAEIKRVKAKASAAPPNMEAYMEEESAFVGHAVHELNTPLTSILGYVDMLNSMGELSDMQKQFLGVVKNNGIRMKGLLSDFRYINKLRKGTLKDEPKMDMFKNISMKLEKELGSRAEELNRQLVFDVPSGLPYVNVDTHLLGIAITKLVENALQYTSEGEGVVTISASGDDGYLVMKISDNGIGMSEAEQARLGEVYFRSERDEVIAFKGSGLGVALAYGVIDLVGGTVEVESAVDQGTTFTIRIKGMG
ncbi:MAG: HAMP domain-containing sensor histidine kinase [Phototrophicaceae bacterium]